MYLKKISKKSFTFRAKDPFSSRANNQLIDESFAKTNNNISKIRNSEILSFVSLFPYVFVRYTKKKTKFCTYEIVSDRY